MFKDDPKYRSGDYISKTLITSIAIFDLIKISILGSNWRDVMEAIIDGEEISKLLNLNISLSSALRVQALLKCIVERVTYYVLAPAPRALRQ